MNYHRAYSQQRLRAGKRGVEFLLSYSEWLQIWLASGQIERRGRGIGMFCMARYGDTGPYAVGNVFITSHEQNSRDWQTTDRAKAVVRKMIKSNTGECGRLAKLTSEKAGEICQRHAAGENWRELAVEYQIGKSTLFNIVNGSSCYDVPPRVVRRTANEVVQ